MSVCVRVCVHLNCHGFGDIKPFTSPITCDCLHNCDNGYIRGERLHNVFCDKATYCDRLRTVVYMLHVIGYSYVTGYFNVMAT